MTPTIKHGIYAVTDRDTLLKTLEEIASFDMDFSDEETGRLNVVLDEIKDLESDERVIKEFFDEWLKYDDYYFDYDVRLLKDDSGKVFAFSYAYVIDWDK